MSGSLGVFPPFRVRAIAPGGSTPTLPSPSAALVTSVSAMPVGGAITVAAFNGSFLAWSGGRAGYDGFPSDTTLTIMLGARGFFRATAGRRLGRGDDGDSFTPSSRVRLLMCVDSGAAWAASKCSTGIFLGLGPPAPALTTALGPSLLSPCTLRIGITFETPLRESSLPALLLLLLLLLDGLQAIPLEGGGGGGGTDRGAATGAGSDILSVLLLAVLLIPLCPPELSRSIMNRKKSGVGDANSHMKFYKRVSKLTLPRT